ncbi:MAG: hypothetical protein ACN6O3_10055 [Comamonas sp.]
MNKNFINSYHTNRLTNKIYQSLFYFLVVLIAVIFVYIDNKPDIDRWSSGHTDAPAWIQAVFGVGAVIAALLVPTI